MQFRRYGPYRVHCDSAHEEVTSLVTPNTFICQTCGRFFTSKDGLDKHSQLHSKYPYKVRPRRLTAPSFKAEIALKRQKRPMNRQLVRPMRRFAQQVAAVQQLQSFAKPLFIANMKSGKIVVTPQTAKRAEGEPTSASSFPAGRSNEVDDAQQKIQTCDNDNWKSSSSSSSSMVQNLQEQQHLDLLDQEDPSSEFTPEVLQNARQYIKAVSRRRKESTMRRLIHNKTTDDPVQHSVHTIGVDVELKRSEESLPIIGKSGGRYSYGCKVCGKVFYNKFHHREHFNVHSGETPYECEFCSKRFAQRSGWNRHIKLHHKYEVFQGPIPYRQLEKKDREEFAAPAIRDAPPQTPTKSLAVVSDKSHKGSPTMASTATAVKIVGAFTDTTHNNRYVPIAPYPRPQPTPIAAFPSGAVPIHPTILSPDRFPKTLETSMSGLIVQASAGVVVTAMAPPQLPENSITMMPQEMIAKQHLPGLSSLKGALAAAQTEQPMHNANGESSSSSTSSTTKSALFQCKKVKTMEGRYIFMIRVAANQTPAAEGELEKKTEFAYILDTDGRVGSRIFVSDHPGGNWVDFPLDNLANEVLLDRIQIYDDKNRRGPKPRHGGFVMVAAPPTMPSAASFHKVFDEDVVRGGSSTGKENFEKALTQQQEEYDASVVVNNEPIPEETSSVSASDATTTQMVTHGRNFRSGKEKRFSCNVCSRKFLAQAHLNDHMLIHTGEFPFKCMFCSRPFRHKSGLNSHHKRHIQNGIFDRPISSKEPNQRIRKNRYIQPEEETTPSSKPLEGGAPPHKSKRKGRPPKRMDSKRGSGGGDSTNIDHEVMNIKEEVKDEVDIDDYMLNMENHRIAFDVQDVFECNFCSMNFPTRTAYLNHVNAEHRVGTSKTQTSLPTLNEGHHGDGEDLNTEFIRMSDFENTLLMGDDIDSPGVPSHVTRSNVEEDSGLGQGLIPDVKIKEEVLDY